MFISVLDIFKVGIGPSSSHTFGPMKAAARFIRELAEGDAAALRRIVVRLYGSLSSTGRGHATDRALMLGLAGLAPESVTQDQITACERDRGAGKPLAIAGLPPIPFKPETDIVFEPGPPLTGHANGMVFEALDAAGDTLLSRTYFSIGGGFVVNEAELAQAGGKSPGGTSDIDVPYPFATADEMLQMSHSSGRSIAEMKRANEESRHDAERLDQGLDRIAAAMNACIDRGLASGGELPGGLKVKRRAAEIHASLKAGMRANDLPDHRINDWLSVWAMAVNEENAAGGQVVTAPTNGAAGVIPAVIRYYETRCRGARAGDLRDFLLVAAAVGGLIKHNASIAGAEVGCQGEVGSASAMAAAGLCAALGGNDRQIENAAEIALEHHLGMTCDPVAGLVQVPCIERNAFGAVKAVTAASLALFGDGRHVVSLDQCVETMRQTGVDMQSKYKETSAGGLAVNVIEC